LKAYIDATASAPADLSVTNAKLATDVKMGSLASLTTTEKGSMQGAVNELDGEIGDLSTLTTTEKGTIVGAINEVDANADAAYVKPGSGIPSTDMTAAVQASLALADSALQTISVGSATPVNAVAASGVLTIAGVCIDGETIDIGDDRYEFAADTAQSIDGASDFAIDITSYTTKSQGTLTVDTQPTAGDTMTIGSKTYTFVPNGTANSDGEISVGTDLATAQANIENALDGSDGHNVAHTQVTMAAFATNDAVITAIIGGTAGDSIATTETFTAGTNVFDAATLGTTTAGVDCTAANAVTAIVAEVTAHDTQGVGAADGAGDTVDLTADTKGVAGNSIATTEAMANGSFGAATLEGGVNGTVGAARELKADSSYLYIAIAANTIADANWRRISVGSVY
jgi:hypothetical protein